MKKIIEFLKRKPLLCIIIGLLIINTGVSIKLWTNQRRLNSNQVSLAMGINESKYVSFVNEAGEINKVLLSKVFESIFINQEAILTECKNNVVSTEIE